MREGQEAQFCDAIKLHSIPAASGPAPGLLLQAKSLDAELLLSWILKSILSSKLLQITLFDGSFKIVEFSQKCSVVEPQRQNSIQVQSTDLSLTLAGCIYCFLSQHVYEI